MKESQVRNSSNYLPFSLTGSKHNFVLFMNGEVGGSFAPLQGKTGTSSPSSEAKTGGWSSSSSSESGEFRLSGYLNVSGGSSSSLSQA